MVTLVNRAKMSTSTTGTGTIALGSAESGYQSFADAGVADADVVRYVIEDGTDWEIGTGTYTASGTTLSRTVSESSNADAALNLSGSAVVFVSAAAEDIPAVQELYAENPSSFTAPSATGTNAIAIGDSATASGSYDLALGPYSSASGGSTFSAQGGTASASSSTAIGSQSVASGASSVALGYNADATGAFSAALGRDAQAITANRAVAIGKSRASGDTSFAAAIGNNTSSYGATGSNSVAIGDRAKATATHATAIGTSVTASQTDGAVAMGSSSTASGLGSFATGYLNIASGHYSQAIGYGANTASIYGKLAKSSGYFSNYADMQAGILVVVAATTDATPKALTSNKAAASTTNQVILPNNSAYAFHGTIVARQQASAGTACAAWKIEGLIRREGSAGTTVLVNSATTVLDNTPAWGMALSADTTNGGLKIEVTGAASTNIRWVATINTSEVTY
jgi:hypothetical protein